eukprot:scaffold23054_cov31-Tisochrysis_lutea.AAC.1
MTRGAGGVHRRAPGSHPLRAQCYCPRCHAALGGADNLLPSMMHQLGHPAVSWPILCRVMSHL